MAAAAAVLLLSLCLLSHSPANALERPADGALHSDSITHEANTNDPSTADVIVHLFEWSWADVATECETFLGPAGYKAVQVSPPQEDIQGQQWWTRYQPVSYKLVSRSGDQEQFADMVARCAAAGVDIIVDAVINHMASKPEGGSGRGGTPIGPGCRRFPEMYGCQDFHHNDNDCCGNCQFSGADEGNLWRIQNCDIGLPDLATSSDWVQQQLAEYLRHLADLGVRGIRVDAAKHIPAWDLRSIVRRAGSNLYYNLEIIVPPWAYSAINLQDYNDIGRQWEFKYPRLLSDAFKPGDRRLDLLTQIGGAFGGGAQWAAADRAISFVVNHDRLVHKDDRPWTVTYFDQGLYQLALIFMLAHPYGQPNVLSSITFTPRDEDYPGAPVDPATGKLIPVHDGAGNPVNCGASKPYLCEHRWPAVAAMVTWRHVADTAPITYLDILNGNAAVSLARGAGGESTAYVLVNTAWKQGGEVHQRLRTGLPAGRYCNVLKEGCKEAITVAADGAADFYLPVMSALALHVEALAPAAG